MTWDLLGQHIAPQHTQLSIREDKDQNSEGTKDLAYLYRARGRDRQYSQTSPSPRRADRVLREGADDEEERVDDEEKRADEEEEAELCLRDDKEDDLRFAGTLSFSFASCCVHTWIDSHNAG